MLCLRVCRTGEMVRACLRMTAQLVLVGHVLGFVFDRPHPLVTLGVLALMVVFAITTVLGRFRGRTTRALRRIVAAGLTLGTLTSTGWFLLVVLRPEPWFDPRFAVPPSAECSSARR